MGIGRQTMRAGIATVKAATNRASLRAQIADMVNMGNELLAKIDLQDASAPVEFAASRLSQYNSFINALPEVNVDPDPVE
jgi:hypothetical protein